MLRTTLLIALFIPGVALAQQQQWASQYVTWSFPEGVAEVYEVDQQVWVAESNAASFWPLVWSWTGSGPGGYLGLQEDSPTVQRVRFSLWDATETREGTCRTFGGEGVGYTCELAFDIQTDRFYRLRVRRQELDGDGYWWQGVLIEADASGTLVEHVVGSIKVSSAFSSIGPISNFVEYYGQALPQCKDVPPSIVGFTLPIVRYVGSQDSAQSTGWTSTPPSGNVCSTGNESAGALISIQPFDFGFSTGALAFMGGPDASPMLDTSDHPVPQGVPSGEQGTDTSPQPDARLQVSVGPNPFASSTSFRFSLPHAGPVRLTVFDTLGRTVAVLVDGIRPLGSHVVSWTPFVADGTYAYQLVTPHWTTSGTLLLSR